MNRLLLLVFFIVCLLNGCGPGQETITIAFSSSLYGNAFECGCPGKQDGGVAERATLIKQRFNSFDSENLIHLDAGGFSNFQVEEKRKQSLAILRAYKQMNIRAVNVTSNELIADNMQLMGALSSEKIDTISSNIVRVSDSKPLLPQYKIISIKGLKVGIIGVTAKLNRTWKFGKDQLEIKAPDEVLQNLIPEVRGKADIIVLMAYIPKIKIKRFVDSIPQVDYILGADGYSYTDEPILYKNTVISFAGSQGKALGLITLEEKEQKIQFVSSKLVHVSHKVEQD